MSMQKVLVIGAGLAGVEASHFLARHGVSVVLAECKRKKLNPAQKIPSFAELVCTNSLKSKDPHSAHGLLKTEMKKLGSVVLQEGERAAVPAGDALAVDRNLFSKGLTELTLQEPLIQVVDLEVDDPLQVAVEYKCQHIIIATGPLTTDKLSQWIQAEVSGDDFYFYDAIAPVVDADTLDLTKLYYKDRHKEVDESADYLNAPMSEEQYYHFVNELVKAEKVPAQNFEDYKFFEACLPIDLMAERGLDTPRFSCMKPIGLELDEQAPPFAVVQLRKENLLGSAFNLVGFQTRLKYPEQLRVFRMIPGFEEAQFNHLGSVHRNSFLNAKKLLHWDMSCQKYPQIHFAGQITGVEGYTESSASGLYVAYQVLKKIKDKRFQAFPIESAMGALVNYIMTSERPAPSNINFGLIPPVPLNKEQRRNRKMRKKIKKQLASERGQRAFDLFLASEDVH
jgi:methylenetetrahydrofolate--tRNA-(uracil-5-)-methyltransferase